MSSYLTKIHSNLRVHPAVSPVKAITFFKRSSSINGRTYTSPTNAPRLNLFYKPTVPVFRVHQPLTRKFTYTPQNNQKYQTLIKHLSPAAIDKLNRLDDSAKLHNIVESIKEGHFKTLDCTDPDLLYFALQGVEKRLLSVEDFTMAAYYWGIRKYHQEYDIQIVSLFDDRGNVNEKAKEIITQTSKLTADLGRTLHQTDVILTPSQIDDFFERMRHEPKAQKLFFVVKDLESLKPLQTYIDAAPEFIKRNMHLVQCISGIKTISQSLHTEIGINLFARFNESENELRMIPSWSMGKIALDVKFGEQAVKMYPTIGFATTSEMVDDAISHRRVCSIPFHDIIYDEADNFAVEYDYDMDFHDRVYHCLMASYIPVGHQKAFALLAQNVMDLKSKANPRYATAFDFMTIRLLDMEHPDYIIRDENSFLRTLSLDIIFSSRGMHITKNAVQTTRKTNENDKQTFLNAFKINDQAAIFRLLSILNQSIIDTTSLYDELAGEGFMTDFVTQLAKQKETFEGLGISFEGLPALAQINSTNIDRIVLPPLNALAKNYDVLIALNRVMNPH